jgi:protein Mpv17
VFWGSNGVLEGKSLAQVKLKVEHAFPQSYVNCVGVFAPTQIVNFTLVPLQHRLLVQQSVGLGKYQNISFPVCSLTLAQDG